jgi:hypothetical protein
LWLEVGVALMYGKQKENRLAGQKFSEWADETFPGLDHNSRADTIRFAEVFSGDLKIPAGLTHPTSVLRWLDKQATQGLPEDLRTITPGVSPTLAPRDAQKVNKLAHRSTSGDEGSETAARMLKAFPT